ncbi:MAG: hypothetical protein AB1589_00960 [Cyanobacteriota bacterium]
MLASLYRSIFVKAVLEMNPQNNRDYDRRLQELEEQVNQESPRFSVETKLGQPFERFVNRSQIQSAFNQAANWFNTLPKSGKVTVAVIAALVAFSVLKTVLQLVASLISLAILGVILYLVYKFFVTPKSPQ